MGLNWPGPSGLAVLGPFCCAESQHAGTRRIIRGYNMRGEHKDKCSYGLASKPCHVDI